MCDYEDSISKTLREIYSESSPEPEDWNDYKTNYTLTLTDECVLRIFLNLDKISLCRAAQTCARWYNISKDRTLWKVVNLTPFTFEIDDYNFQTLIKSKMNRTEKLHFGSMRVTFKMLRSISNNCREMKMLVFGRNCSIEEITRRRQRIAFPKRVQTVDLRMALGDFEFLIDLQHTFYHLINFGIGPRSFNRISLPYMFAKLPNLRTVDFTNCPEIDDAGLQVLSIHCPNVESICLIGCRHIYGTTFPSLIKNCKNLRTLLLRYLKIEDEVLAQDVWKDSVIEELDVSACPRITWQGLFPFLSQLKHVTYLNMSYCGEGHAVNDTVLFEMANTGIAERLKMLDLRWSFYITPNALASFIPKCKQLEYLGIYQSFQVKADDIAALIIHLPTIKILEFGCSYPQELNRSRIIPKLMTSAKNIEVLSLINFTSCSSKDDYKYLKSFMKKSCKLKRINFCDCSPELVKMGKEASKSIKRVEVTVKWECALPPPKNTLDSIILDI